MPRPSSPPPSSTTPRPNRGADLHSTGGRPTRGGRPPVPWSGLWNRSRPGHGSGRSHGTSWSGGCSRWTRPGRCHRYACGSPPSRPRCRRARWETGWPSPSERAVRKTSTSTAAPSRSHAAARPDGRHSQAHRIAYLLDHGLTADDLDPETKIRHKCPGGSNPACCNPAHLEPGTQRENIADRMAEGKYARGDAHFSTKVPDAVIRALREDYWPTPRKARPKLRALAERHGVEDRGTVRRWLHGKSRREAGGPMGEIATTADVPDALF